MGLAILNTLKSFPYTQSVFSLLKHFLLFSSPTSLLKGTRWFSLRSPSPTSLMKWTRRILQRIKYFLAFNLFFLLLDSTFCLDTKGGAKKSRQFDAVLFLWCIISSDELPIATVMLTGQSIGAITKLRAMLPFLGALMFCA
jgi:hypothetical protein